MKKLPGIETCKDLRLRNCQGPDDVALEASARAGAIESASTLKLFYGALAADLLKGDVVVAKPNLEASPFVA